jgi:hypothetical protein
MWLICNISQTANRFVTIKTMAKNKYFNVFPLPNSIQKICPIPRSYVTFCNTLLFHVELLALCPTPKLEDHNLSAVRGCLLSIFSVVLPLLPSAIWRSDMTWWQGTPLTWNVNVYSCDINCRHLSPYQKVITTYHRSLRWWLFADRGI